MRFALIVDPMKIEGLSSCRQLTKAGMLNNLQRGGNTPVLWAIMKLFAKRILKFSIKIQPLWFKRWRQSERDKSKPNPIEAVSQYLESLLRKIKNFEGCSVADEAKQELKTYMRILQKNEITLQALKTYNPDLAQETHLFMQLQINNKGKGMERWKLL